MAREKARMMRTREMTGTGCKSRHFSRIVRSCCPTPDTPQYFVPPPNNPTVSRPKFVASTSVNCLPDDVLYEVLSRVPLPSLPSASAVCRRWSRLIDSDSFSLLRRNHHRLHPTLFAFSLTDTTSFSFSFSTVRLFKDEPWNDVVPFNLPSYIVPEIPHARVTAVGRKVCIVTRSSCLLFDPWTGSVKSRSEPIIPRKRFAIASVNGKVYVAGGSTYDTSVEEFNPVTNEWRVVSHAPRRRYGCIGVGVDNTFYIIGGLKIGGACDTRADARAVTRATSSEARVFASSMDIYDTVARGWLRSRVVPGGGCVVAACGAAGSLYLLASHAVELSFWRFDAKRRDVMSVGAGAGAGASAGGGVGGGEWCRMRGPPVAGQVRIGGRVKFGCVGVEGKVVLVQVMGCGDDLLRRSGRNVRGIKQGIVFFFDCVTHEWSRALDLPQLVQRPHCVCVDC